MRPKAKLTPLDHAFWVALFRLRIRWKEVLVIVKPDALVRWRHKGFLACSGADVSAISSRDSVPP